MQDWLMRDRVPERLPFIPHSLRLPLRLDWSAKLRRGVLQAQIVGDAEQLFVATGSALYALNPETGAVLWEVLPERHGDEQYSVNRGTPAICGEYLFYADMFGYLSCYDRATGAIIWERADLQARDVSLAVYHNRLFLHAQRLQPSPTKRSKYSSGCACLELDGTLVWFSEAVDNVTTRDVAIKDDRLIIGDRAGFVTALDVTDGHLIWQTDLKPSFAQLANLPSQYISGSVMIAGSTIVVRSQSTTHFFGLDMASGAIRWMHDWMSAWPDVGASPIDNWGCDNQHLYYISYYTTRSCVDVIMGQTVWSTGVTQWPATHTGEKTGAIIGDYYFAGFEPVNTFAAFEQRTGRITWEFNAESAITGSPSWINGRILVGCSGGHVYAFTES